MVCCKRVWGLFFILQEADDEAEDEGMTERLGKLPRHHPLIKDSMSDEGKTPGGTSQGQHQTLPRNLHNFKGPNLRVFSLRLSGQHLGLDI